MKFQQMLAKFLGWAIFKSKDNQVDLTTAEHERLNTLLGVQEAATLIEQVNLELSGVEDAKTELQNVKTELENKNKEVTEQAATIKNLTTDLNKLAGAAETVAETVDTVKAVFGSGPIVAISGFLMGIQEPLFGMDRPWNARAVAGMSAPATNFKNDLVLNTLNEDIKGFVAEYPNKFEDLFEKKYNLPELWKKHTIFGVVDKIVSAVILTEEVTQPRKAVWVPKGGVTIQPEVMEVKPAQIDIQFNYWKLQAIEKSWMYGFNKEGNQAYKMSFIEYLLIKYLEKARSEDADVLVRGVFSEKPENYDKPVTYLIRNNGVFKQLFDARDINKKYRAFYLGDLTETNILDYVEKVIQSLPLDVRGMDLQWDWSPYWIRKYKERDRDVYGGNTDYTGLIKTPRDFDNIEFVPVPQLEGSKFFFITFKDNVKPLENNPKEKSMLTIEKSLRDVYAFADYSIGIGVNHIGLETSEDNPLKYELQAVWSNTEPLFDKNFYIPVFDFNNGVVKANHNRITPVVDFTTDITSIKGNIGNYLFIRGNISLAGSVKVIKNTELLLTADFDLKSGGTLTLVRKGNTWKEVSRTTAPETAPSSVEFEDDTIIYEKSNQFIYKGDTAVNLENITGGSEGNTIRIFGGAAIGSALTVKTIGIIKTDSDYVMDSPAKYIDLIFIEGIWTEYARG